MIRLRSLAMTTQTRATMDDLMRVPGKAELVNGEIVHMPPTGDSPGRAGDRIYMSLQRYEDETGTGRAVSDNKAFRTDLPHRESFSPDAAFYTGPRGGMKFYPEPPVFAVEVRSEGDYGPAAEQALARKRRDYFDAGARVVWDVDLLSDDVVRKYSAENPAIHVLFRRGEIADAEPAVPGWKMSVDELFR
jgi:Uma2 family endonuclease